MTASATITTPAHGWTRILAWPRVRFTLLASLPFGFLLSFSGSTPMLVWFGRTATVGLLAMLAFGVLERWPKRLPRRLARWVAQLLGVFAAVPIGAFIAYWWTTGGDPQIPHNPARMFGFSLLVSMGLIFAPWMALAALLRQREAFAQHQALAFALERSELERQALDARMRLLQAQVQPHFLFNTLANVRALVNAGSPRAVAVLDSLIAYLRATVARLNETATTLGQELDLVRAYLALMHMRMPDRLQFTVQADADATELRCPPMTILTLVENAVRHGIDPSEEGGRIEVAVERRATRCLARVVDTGVGLTRVGEGLGTGLATLRERLRLTFGESAQLRLTALSPHGVRAELDFPAEPVARSAT